MFCLTDEFKKIETESEHYRLLCAYNNHFSNKPVNEFFDKKHIWNSLIVTKLKELQKTLERVYYPNYYFKNIITDLDRVKMGIIVAAKNSSSSNRIGQYYEFISINEVYSFYVVLEILYALTKHINEDTTSPTYQTLLYDLEKLHRKYATLENINYEDKFYATQRKNIYKRKFYNHVKSYRINHVIRAIEAINILVKTRLNQAHENQEIFIYLEKLTYYLIKNVNNYTVTPAMFFNESNILIDSITF